MSKTKILYKDVAPYAEDDATVTSENYETFSELQRMPHGIDNSEIMTLELNQWLLDGSRELRENHTHAFWSQELTDADGNFASAPVITITTSKQYSSVGLTLVFGGESYATAVNVKWYQGTTLLQEGDFTPDGMTYFFNQQVQSYNKIVMTFSAMSLPYRRLKVNHLIFGLHREFGMAELRSAKITNDIGLISQELPISKLNWELDSKSSVDYMFQLKQPVEAWNNNRLIGVYYIDQYSRKAEKIYDIECYDAFGVLSENLFSGGVYSGKSAKALISEIVGDAFTVTYSDDVTDKNLTGAILSENKRDALQQVLFAWGVCAATDGDTGIHIFNLPTDYKSIGKDKTFSGVSVDTSAVVTQVIVYAHAYSTNSNGSVTINGTKYNDTKTAYSVSNPNIIATDKQNVVKVDGATLVSSSNAQEVAQRVYNYYTKRDTEKAKIVWDGEHLGNAATLPNGWNGTQSGNIAKMGITLSNTVVADIELR